MYSLILRELVLLQKNQKTMLPKQSKIVKTSVKAFSLAQIVWLWRRTVIKIVKASVSVLNSVRDMWIAHITASVLWIKTRLQFTYVLSLCCANLYIQANCQSARCRRRSNSLISDMKQKHSTWKCRLCRRLHRLLFATKIYC